MKKMKEIIKNSKGFTLIELLVVIAIIAVLAVAVILTLNPAELLKQARDSTRVSDMSTMKSAMSLYLADVATPTQSSTCALSVAFSAGSITTCGNRYTISNTLVSSSQSGNFSINGTGWIPVDFTAISSGAPIGNLPRDPSNASTTAPLYYSYVGSSTSLVFELAAKMESSKYSKSGGSDVESTDGGGGPVSSTIFQVGTNLAL